MAWEYLKTKDFNKRNNKIICSIMTRMDDLKERRIYHIKNWKDNIDLRYLISNGITFCDSCHREFHKKFGYKNNNEKQLLSFIK